MEKVCKGDLFLYKVLIVPLFQSRGSVSHLPRKVGKDRSQESTLGKKDLRTVFICVFMWTEVSAKS